LYFETGSRLAQIIARAIEAGVPFGWVAADEVYGQNTLLRDWQEDHDVRYVLAAPLSQLVTVAGAQWEIEECFQAAGNEAGL
jgi:SRSO17 transposase